MVRCSRLCASSREPSRNSAMSGREGSPGRSATVPTSPGATAMWNCRSCMPTAFLSTSPAAIVLPEGNGPKSYPRHVAAQGRPTGGACRSSGSLAFLSGSLIRYHVAGRRAGTVRYPPVARAVAYWIEEEYACWPSDWRWAARSLRSRLPDVTRARRRSDLRRYLEDRPRHGRGRGR